MTAFSEALKQRLVRDFKGRLAAGDGKLFRPIFSGPPRDVLERLFEVLSEGEGLGEDPDRPGVRVPVLLVGKAGDDPREVDSCRCSVAYATNVRTSSISQYILLRSPGVDLNQSLVDASSEISYFAPENLSSSEASAFKALLDQGISLRGFDPAEAWIVGSLASTFAEAAATDEGEADDPERWSLLRRIYDSHAGGGQADLLWTLGLPSAPPDRLGSREHLGILHKLAKRLEGAGISAGIESLGSGEHVEDAVREALGEFKTHLLMRCELPSEFLAAPSLRYSSTPAIEALPNPPSWWRVLDLETWETLLGGPFATVGQLRVQCVDPERQSGSGLPCVFRKAAKFEIQLKDHEGPARVRVSSAVGRRESEELQIVDLTSGSAEFEDASPQDHTSPLSYSFDLLDGTEAISERVRVIALDSYAPGFVVVCRSAKRLGLPRAPKKPDPSEGEPADYECEVELGGMGVHQLEILHRLEDSLSDEIRGYDVTTEQDGETSRPISELRSGVGGCTVELDEECYYDFKTERPDGETIAVRVRLRAPPNPPLAAESEFASLVLQNQVGGGPEAQATSVQVGSTWLSRLQRSILASEHSYAPIWLGPDYEDVDLVTDWSAPVLLSRKRLLHDPRPSPSEMNAPQEFIDARLTVLQCMEKHPEWTRESPVEQLRFWELEDHGFEVAVLAYLRTYHEWLEARYEHAAWSDLTVLGDLEPGGGLDQIPYAVLLGPLHPVRLAWMLRAQSVLWKTLTGGVPCPAAGVIESSGFPDCFALPWQSPMGHPTLKAYLAVESSSDYWAVMWSYERLQYLHDAEKDTHFTRRFGIQVEGLAAGFSEQQVRQALNEISRIAPAKSSICVSLWSDTAGSSSCNDGVLGWAADSLGPDSDPWHSASGRRVAVLDYRPRGQHPSAAELSMATSDTEGCLSWYYPPSDSGTQLSDLGIVAHLGIGAPELTQSGLRSPVDWSCLLRHRIRRQVGSSGDFIAETKCGTFAASNGKGELLDAIAASLATLERQFGEVGDTYVFAPRIQTLRDVLAVAGYCAVSSSAVDPACFFGTTAQSLLWNYELPSLSRRAGERAGYYLLAVESPVMRRAVTVALNMLHESPVNEKPELVGELIHEISARGMPTLKNLTSGGMAALGEVGMLVALRLLQSDFCADADSACILPALEADPGYVSLVLPVDPFANYFDALRKRIPDQGGERPDLLVCSMRLDADGAPVSMRLTPIEVKARSDAMPSGGRKSALKRQAKRFADFLIAFRGLGDQHELWGVTWRHVLSLCIDYGFRVYGQLDRFRQSEEWSRLHQRTLQRVLGGELRPDIDVRGRLVVVDISSQDRVLDLDGDGFGETLELGHSFSHQLLSGQGESHRAKLLARIGDWELRPPLDEQGLSGRGGAEHRPPDGPPQGGDVELSDGQTSGEAVGTGNEDSVGEGTDAGDHVPGDDDPENGSADEQTTIEANSAQDLEPLGDGIRFAVGESLEALTARPLHLWPSNTALTQLNTGIVGNLGTGKTQLIKALVYKLAGSGAENRGRAPKILIFDYKKDYIGKEFCEAVGARVVSPYRIPLNLFDPRGCTNQNNPAFERSRFFTDVLQKIYAGIGAKQRQFLRMAVKEAYGAAKSSGANAPTLVDVFRAYDEMDETSVDSPYGIMSGLVEQEMFVERASDAMPFAEFLDGVVVLNLAELGQDDESKHALVAIMLNFYYEYMLRIPKQPFLGTDPSLRAIDSFVLVDEADSIMRYEFDVLRRILLQGREFGAGVILASQYLSHFKTAHENYREPLLTWFIHQVPNITAKELQEIGLSGIQTNTVDRVKALKCHECLYKSLDIEGIFMRGTPFFRLIADA